MHRPYVPRTDPTTNRARAGSKRRSALICDDVQRPELFPRPGSNCQTIFDLTQNEAMPRRHVPYRRPTAARPTVSARAAQCLQSLLVKPGEGGGSGLPRLHAFVTSIHNTRFTIEVLVLQALLDHAQGNNQNALAALQRAVTLAQPGGFVRVFVDLGPKVADLLRRLIPTGATRQYVDQILRAFPPERLSPPPQPRPVEQPGMIEPLTRREVQVLELLAQHMTTTEIAERLILSDQTVKRHLANIYQKLGVHSRRQAVSTAVALGILPSASRSAPLE
jgi:DNA-binding NarL/FixJ family response regulator